MGETTSTNHITIACNLYMIWNFTCFLDYRYCVTRVTSQCQLVQVRFKSKCINFEFNCYVQMLLHRKILKFSLIFFTLTTSRSHIFSNLSLPIHITLIYNIFNVEFLHSPILGHSFKKFKFLLYIFSISWEC